MAVCRVLIFFGSILINSVLHSQELPASVTPVPAQIRYSGNIPSSYISRSNILALTFSFYETQESNSALWSETQNVQLSPDKHYDVVVGNGAVGGIPIEIFRMSASLYLQVFANGEPVGERTMFLSVPYAFKSSDSASLAGRPSSDFVLRSEFRSQLLEEIQALADMSAKAGTFPTDPKQTIGPSMQETAVHSETQATTAKSEYEKNNLQRANQFVGADWCAKIQAAHDDLPVQGGIVDVSAVLDTQMPCHSDLVLNKPIKLLLGAGFYVLGNRQIRTNSSDIQIIGVSMGATKIIYSGNAGAIVGSLGGQNEIDNLVLQDFTLDGHSSKSSVGILQITPVRHHYMRIQVTGFEHNIKLDGSANYGTLNVLDAVTSRDCKSTALWLFGDQDPKPSYSGRTIANTTVTGGDYHCQKHGTSIRLDSAQIVYLASNIIENATTGTGVGVHVTGNSKSSSSMDVKIIANDFEGLEVGTLIDSNADRTTIIANSYFHTANQTIDRANNTSRQDITGTAATLFSFARGLEVKPTGTRGGSRMILDADGPEPRIGLYRATGSHSWYPYWIQNNGNTLEFARGDATNKIGDKENVHPILSLPSMGGAVFRNASGNELAKITSLGQISSNALEGTPPLVVHSSTAIPQLNASLLNGSTFQDPGPIGITTPAAANFTRLKVTSGIAQGSGAKHKRVSIGSIGPGTRASINVVWDSKFTDSNYTVTATLLDESKGSIPLSLECIRSLSPGGIIIQVVNHSSHVKTGTLHLIAIHD
ncbi:MAG: hypothetical protein JWO13_1210 [Acidobacteriales bacterium]|nr:hypothetical protein [Terriglobales bacterium]